MTQLSLDRDTVLGLVVSTLRNVLPQSGQSTLDLGEQTKLVGTGAVIDSLGLVTLVVDMEQLLEQEYGHRLVLANDRAMSMRHSPFRTVGSLTDYVLSLLAEAPSR